MTYNINQEWGEPLTLRDQLGLQIGLQISDNLSLPWQDGVSFIKPATTVATAGQTSQASISEDLPMAPQGDGVKLLFALQLVLTDNLSTPWKDGVSFLLPATTVATAGQVSQAQISEDLPMAPQGDLAAISLIGVLSMSFGESINFWLDTQPQITGEYDLVIVCPEFSGLWNDSQLFGIGLNLSDTLTLSDSLSTGYGNGTVDQLTFSDSSGIGYGDQISDTLTMSDALGLVLTLGFALSDTLTLSDILRIGYGDQVSDSLTLLDSIATGYGNGTVDELTFSDSTKTGYGDQISDTLTMSDAIAIGFPAEALTLSDTLTLSDALILGYGDQISDTMTMSDVTPIVTGEYDLVITCPEFSTLWQDAIAENLAGSVISESFSDSMTMSDALGLGYGDKVTDSTTMSDAFTDALLGAGLTETLSDTMTLSDGLAIGYGDQVADTLVMNDVSPTITGEYDLVLACPHFSTLWADALSTNLTTGALTEVLADSLTLSDALKIGYGDQTADTMTLSDFQTLGYGNLVTDTVPLADSDSINFLMAGSAAILLFISEQMFLSDTLTTVGPPVPEVFSDQLLQADAINFVLAGGAEVIYIEEVMQQMDWVDMFITIPIFADDMTFSDNFNLTMSFEEPLSDTMTMSDAFAEQLLSSNLAEQLSDTLVLSDLLRIGYGDLISDQLTMSDAVVPTLALLETLTDTMTLTDSMLLGYGNSLTDTMTMSDSIASNMPVVAEALSDTMTLSDFLRLGYGNLITDTLTITDSVGFLFPLGITFTETLTLTDQNSLGYGFLISDQLTMSEAVASTWGMLITEQLTQQDSIFFALLGALISLFPNDELLMSDGIVIGYADLITDSLVLSEQVGLGYGNILKDTLTLSDVMAFSYVLFESPSDTLTLSDSSKIGYGDQVSDTLVMSENIQAGIGNQITDQMTLQENLIMGFALILQDQMAAQVDQLGAGYGNNVNDQMATQADQIAIIQELDLLIADANPTQLDALNTLMAYALDLDDAIIFQEQMVLMYGIIVGDDSLEMADNINPALQNLIALALADDNSADMLDAILELLIFAPSTIVCHTIAVEPELTVASLRLTRSEV